MSRIDYKKVLNKRCAMVAMLEDSLQRVVLVSQEGSASGDRD
jgi:hypothetical protein